MGLYPGLDLVKKGEKSWIKVNKEHKEEYKEMGNAFSLKRYFWPSIKEEGVYVMYSVVML